MDDSEKIKKLAEDYQNAQRVIAELNNQRVKVEKSDEYLLGKKIFDTWWLRIIGESYRVARSIKAKMSGKNITNHNRPFKYNIDYSDILSLFNCKIAVYTCITGTYDIPREPLFKTDNVDYILVTDGAFQSTGTWKQMDIRTIKGVPAGDDFRISRYIKLKPHLFLEDYDYSVYIDGNMKITGDIRFVIHLLNQYGFVAPLHRMRNCIYEESASCIHQKKSDPETTRRQIDSYKSAGMPHHYGLIEASMLVRNHKNPVCIEIMEKWWQEIMRYSTRDQISLPFVLWQMNIPVSEIGSISNNVYEIPLIQIMPHSQC